jgi:hypothetical protein
MRERKKPLPKTSSLAKSNKKGRSRKGGT